MNKYGKVERKEHRAKRKAPGHIEEIILAGGNKKIFYLLPYY
jgi:hypothetical protein